ncbi:hypothetical protein FQA39_LY12600 [Lamprigera yunnana]|nr:hypothetical protein FQA39_LY12600 [Lamprigera yunnana]
MMHLLKSLEDNFSTQSITESISMATIGIEKNIHEAIYYKRLERELYGRHLKIATMQNGILSGAINVNNTWIGNGIAFELIQLLQELYNFQYTVVVPVENVLGSKEEGIFELIFKEAVDLAAAFLPITSVYWEYANFASCLDMGDWIGVLKRPQELVPGSVFAPFEVDAWIFIVLCILITGIAIFGILRISIQSSEPKSLTDCLLFAYGALLKQSSTIKPHSDSARLVFGTWWLFIMLITAFYTANLTAFLTLSVSQLPIKSTADIIAKKYSIIAKAGNVLETTINHDLENLYNDFSTSKKIFTKENDDSILENWVKNENYIYLAEKPNIDMVLYENYLRQNNADISQLRKCSYVTTSWSVYKWSRSFAYSKSFKYGPLFDKALRSFVEAGLIKHYYNKNLPKKNYCPVNLNSTDRQLCHADFLITYYILTIGLLISFLIFGLEIMYQEEVEQLNEVAHQKPHSQLIANIQKENRHLREIQQENRELRAALEEHQSALEHIMSKYRQHTNEQIYKSRINFLALQDHNYNDVITQQAEKIQEMAAVMDYAAFIDESQANKSNEILSQLKTENQGLRELLEISCKSGSYNKTINGPKTEDKRYNQMKTQIVNESTTCTTEDFIRLKHFFADRVNSTRRLDNIQTVPQLIDILEKRSVLNNNDLKCFEDLSKFFNIHPITGFIYENHVKNIETSAVTVSNREEIYDLICNEIGRKWKNFARPLGVGNAKIDEIDDAYKLISEKARKVLECYESKHNLRTWVPILEALSKSRRVDLRLKVQELLSRNS